jgi:hypothetical protein
VEPAAFDQARDRLRVARYVAGRDQDLLELIAKQARGLAIWQALGYRNHAAWREQLPIPTGRTWSAPNGGPIVVPPGPPRLARLEQSFSRRVTVGGS